MNVDHLSRQLSLIPMDTLTVKVNIIGCGAIGSFLALSLAKMGITRIEMWDFDSVSIENMSNQFYRFADIGSPKAVALAGLVNDFTGVTPKPNISKLETLAGLDGIVIVAVDTMAARKQLFESLAGNPHTIKLLIDPRMSAEMYQQYTVTTTEAHDWYKKTLFTDEEGVATPCTAKSTVYTATLAAGLVVKTIKNFILKEDVPRNIQWDIKSCTPMEIFSGNARAPRQGPTPQAPSTRPLQTLTDAFIQQYREEVTQLTQSMQGTQAGSSSPQVNGTPPF